MRCPVTLGNIVGGSGFVGFVYWVIYRKGFGAVRK
jgi:formate transporter